MSLIRDFLDKWKSKRHKAIKKKIEQLQTERGIMLINKTIPPFRIVEMDKRIKALQKKLRG